MSGFFDTELDDAGIAIGKIVDDTITGIKLVEVIKIVSFVSNLTVDFATNGKGNATTLLDTLNQDVVMIHGKIGEIQQSIDNIYNSPACNGICQAFIDRTNIQSTVVTIQEALGKNTIISGIITEIDNIVFNDSTLEEIEGLVDLTHKADTLLGNFSEAFVQDYTQVVRDKVDKVKDNIKRQVVDLTKELQDIDLNNVDTIKDISKTLDDITDVSSYILKWTLGPAIILTIALLLSCIGLIIGTTFYTNDHYNSSCLKICSLKVL